MANINRENGKEFYSLAHFEAGQKFAEINGAIVEVLECKVTNYGCYSMLVKLYGGSLMRITTAEENIYTTSETKRKLPAWLKRGMVIYDWKNREELIIESVGNCRVQLRYEGSADLRNIILETTYVKQQPVVPVWATVGARVKRGRQFADILSIDGYMAKIRLQIGGGQTCDLDASINELRPGYNEHEYGMSDEEIQVRRDALYLRVYKGGSRTGKEDHFMKSELQELEELSCRSMINSCLIYGQLYDFFDEKSEKFVSYGKDFEESLGYDLTLKLLVAQQERFKHAEVGYAGEDYEGCSYNYCKWDVA